MNEKIAEGEDAGLKCRQIHTREHTRKTWWWRGQAHRFEQFNDLLRSAALPDNRQTHAAEELRGGLELRSARAEVGESLNLRTQKLKTQRSAAALAYLTATPPEEQEGGATPAEYDY